MWLFILPLLVHIVIHYLPQSLYHCCDTIVSHNNTAQRNMISNMLALDASDLTGMTGIPLAL